MKKFFIALSFAALLSTATVFAQDLSKKDKFYQTVPRHEFFIEGFGGFAPLVYTVDQYSFGDPTAGQTPAPSTVTTVETPMPLSTEAISTFSTMSPIMFRPVPGCGW